MIKCIVLIEGGLIIVLFHALPERSNFFKCGRPNGVTRKHNVDVDMLVFKFKDIWAESCYLWMTHREYFLHFKRPNWEIWKDMTEKNQCSDWNLGKVFVHFLALLLSKLSKPWPAKQCYLKKRDPNATF